MFYSSTYYAFFPKTVSRSSSTTALKGADSSNRRVLVLLGLAVLLIPIYRFFTMQYVVIEHPIDALMSAAQLSHRNWLAQASVSKSLADAVNQYRARYGCDPPP